MQTGLYSAQMKLQALLIAGAMSMPPCMSDMNRKVGQNAV